METIIALMKEIGFTGNEAKAYIGLLKHQPATGYEIAARSGIPRSAIYNVLKKLKGVGLVNAVHHKPMRYVALPPAQLHTLMKDRFTNCLDEIKDSLEGMARPMEGAFLWQIQGYRSVLDRARGLIERSQELVAASIWSRGRATSGPSSTAVPGSTVRPTTCTSEGSAERQCGCCCPGSCAR